MASSADGIGEQGRGDYERAQLGYDDKHEKALIEEFLQAIVKVSLISNPPVLVLRTGEIANALTTVLTMTLAMSPSVVRSPHAIRDITDRMRKRLIKGAADPAMRDFLDRVFQGDVADRKRGGNA
jgi:hypothetical protein